ncbi:MAG: type II toxin-antitoxin system death-on-curing family toxin [Deltaproteobacteria bacterium]|nr:type II toxin-antitoxin system death-on-curing family toxin [Deltaproteobacteria bacterium]
MVPIFLTLNHALSLHKLQIDRFGGSHGVRDMPLLESALMQSQSGFGGEYAHKDLYEMAAAYLFHICQNHPFVDGNKRVALMVALVFLEINGIDSEYSDDMLETMVLDVANGNLKKSDIAEFFKKHAL